VWYVGRGLLLSGDNGGGSFADESKAPTTQALLLSSYGTLKSFCILKSQLEPSTCAELLEGGEGKFKQQSINHTGTVDHRRGTGAERGLILLTFQGCYYTRFKEYHRH
jgi:hypothetical protein